MATLPTPPQIPTVRSVKDAEDAIRTLLLYLDQLRQATEREL